MRGISTVVDATVFLLLVGGAIATLVAGTGTVQPGGERPPSPGNPAAEDARILSTTTATVNYSMAPAASSHGGCVQFDSESGDSFGRTAHGTLASLLADAVVGNVTVAGQQLSHAGDEFERNLSFAVRDRTGRRELRTSVVATWEPYPDAPVGGEVRVGDRPPRNGDVHAATLEIDGGVPASRERARTAARKDGFQGVARVLADAVVTGLFPPRKTQQALRGEYPVDALTAQRYCRAADLLDARAPALEDGNATESNDGLRVGLAHRLESDIAAQYDSPEAAARAVDTDSVEITVRTWSP